VATRIAFASEWSQKVKILSEVEVRQVAERSRHVPTFNRVATWMVGVSAALTLAGCGGEGTSDEELIAEMEKFDSVSAALSQSSCAAAIADFTATGKVDPVHVSPQSYNTCFKGYVVDVNNLLGAYTGTGDLNARIAVHWADSALTNQTDCENTHIRAIFYKKVSGNWVVKKDETAWGTWSGLFGGQCGLESNLMGMTAGSSYRVAATARTPGGETRQVSIGTYKPIIIN
jgi:hypothetical protein